MRSFNAPMTIFGLAIAEPDTEPEPAHVVEVALER